MLGPGYFTTTVEYYEYQMPEMQSYAMAPAAAAMSCLMPVYEDLLMPCFCPMNCCHNNSAHSSFGCARSELPTMHLTMLGGNRHQSGSCIHGLDAQPRVFEYDEQASEDQLSNAEEREEEAFHASESDCESKDATEAPITNPKSKRKRIYQAEQGYLVEEPTSETSEGDHESDS